MYRSTVRPCLRRPHVPTSPRHDRPHHSPHRSIRSIRYDRSVHSPHPPTRHTLHVHSTSTHTYTPHLHIHSTSTLDATYRHTQCCVLHITSHTRTPLCVPFVQDTLPSSLQTTNNSASSPRTLTPSPCVPPVQDTLRPYVSRRVHKYVLHGLVSSNPHTFTVCPCCTGNTTIIPTNNSAQVRPHSHNDGVSLYISNLVVKCGVSM